MKHFRLTDESIINSSGIKLYRLDLADGIVGGFVEGEHNIEGKGLVCDNAQVFGQAKVTDNAIVYANARVMGNAIIAGDAKVFGDALIYDYSYIHGNASIYGNSRVSGYTSIYGNSVVGGNAWVSGGEWHEAPLQIRGSRGFITCAKPFHLQIDCRLYSFKEWKSHFRKIGQLEEYTPAEIKEYETYIDLAIEKYGLEPK